MDSRPENAKRFFDEYLRAFEEVDLLGSWAYGESFFEKELRHVQLCKLGELNPWAHENPWTAGLEGKRVLVVHPFKDSILNQYYKKREKIFPGSHVLPEFELRVVQAFLPGVRDTGRAKYDFFGKVDVLLEEIFESSFDVAIIGSGPNGFLLAAEVKRRGFRAVHLGGSTQLLFGIRGKRWDDTGFDRYNRHWVRPLPTETPPNYQRILDKGAYW